MQKVYLVTKSSHSDYRIVGAFSTPEKAREFLQEEQLARLHGQHPDAQPLSEEGFWLVDPDLWDLRVEEFSVDSLPPLEWAAWTADYPNHGRQKFIGPTKALAGHRKIYSVELASAARAVK